jgi:flavorubredoxin
VISRRRSTVLLVVLVVLAAAIVLSYLWLNREVVSEVEVRNPEGGAGMALVVYHPGRSDFQEKVTYAFAESLVSSGWRVEITTASSQAPTDLSGYDLLVLGGPTYWFTPARPVRRYLNRLGDLRGQRTVTIITAMGLGGRSISIMDQDVREANGDLVKSLILYTMRPNEDLYGINDAVEIVTQAAKEVPLPGE